MSVVIRVDHAVYCKLMTAKMALEWATGRPRSMNDAARFLLSWTAYKEGRDSMVGPNLQPREHRYGGSRGECVVCRTFPCREALSGVLLVTDGNPEPPAAAPDWNPA